MVMKDLLIVVLLCLLVAPAWGQGTGVGYIFGVGVENLTISHSLPLIVEPLYVSGDLVAARELVGLGASVRLAEPLDWTFARLGLKMSEDLRAASQLVHLGGGVFVKDWDFKDTLRAGGYAKVDLLKVTF